MTDELALHPIDFYERVGLLIGDDYVMSEHVREAFKVLMTALNAPRKRGRHLEQNLLVFYGRDVLGLATTWHALLHMARILDKKERCPSNLNAYIKEYTDVDTRMLPDTRIAFAALATCIQEVCS